MTSFAIDDIIGHLNTLKEQEIQLKLKDEQIKKYEDLLLTYKSTRFDDCFLIYSYGEDHENIEIIAKNFMEFTELAYDRHYLLVAKKESNRNVAIYLMAFSDNCQLESTVQAIGLLIGRKRRQQEEKDSNRMPISREMRKINKILVGKVEEYERKIREQEIQLKEYAQKTENCERRIVEQTKKMEENEQKLKKKEEQIEQIRQQVFKAISSSKPGLRLFLQDKNLEMIKSSTVVMNGLENRLFEREEGDSDRYDPPLREINSQELRRKEVLDFIVFIRSNLNNLVSGTVIQQNIHNWFRSNRQQFRYNPSEGEKEKSRKMFLNKFKLENTIGTIHFLNIQFSDCTLCYCFAISNYRIVHWSWNGSQQDASSFVNNDLKQLPTWTENSKFATEMEVNEYQSDTFIHTSNKDVFVENEKVLTWIKNNFNLEQRNNEYEYACFSIIPTLYHLLVEFYDILI